MGGGGAGGVLLPREFVEHALGAGLAIGRLGAADEERHGAAVRQLLLDDPPDGLTSLVVIDPDEAQPPGLVGVVVHRDERHLLGDPGEVFRLVLRVDDAHGDPAQPLLHPRIDDGGLGAGVERLVELAELEVDVVVAGGLVRPGLGEAPELGGAVGYDPDLYPVGLLLARRHDRQYDRQARNDRQTQRSEHGITRDGGRGRGNS